MKMKRLRHYWFTSISLISCLIFVSNPGFADDSCIFTVDADAVTPNIVILFDNGAEMKHVAWHSSYDPAVDYTPRDGIDNDGINGIDDAGEIDDAGDAEIAWRREVSSTVAADRGKGNGFFHENGYSICGTDSLVPIDDNLLPGVCNQATNDKIVAVSTVVDNDDTDFATFSIYKGDGVDNDGINGIDDAGEDGVETWATLAGTITLAATANDKVFPAGSRPAGDTGEIIDNAEKLRYSKNYLNWLFFSGSYDGTDLPKVSRLYYAKKAILTTAKLTSNKANFALFRFRTADGAANLIPLGPAVDTIAADPANNVLDSDFVNRINSMATVTYSPIAEGLQGVGYYFSSSAISSYVDYEYCQKHFALVVTPGISSEDTGTTSSRVPVSLSDAACVATNDPCGDNDGAAADLSEGEIKEDSTIYTIPTNLGGTTYLDDVAHYLYTHKVVGDTTNNGVWDGTSNVLTYTVGFMGNHESNLFLINTSNNGNGEKNLYDTSDLDYGKWHYVAENPDDLAEELLEAVNAILSQSATFTAPVVPVTRTTSGNRIYLAFFKPGEGNFWEGNVTKFGLSDADQIVDIDGNAATWPNGAIKEDAVAYWATKNWADITKSNYIHNSSRTIYTYLGGSLVEFNSDNVAAADLGNPTHTAQEIIDYIRGADVFDEDEDGDTGENREIITGDVLHSEPCVVQYDSDTTMVFFGANDGMLHAVSDSDGTEMWAFIPPDQLPRLKDIVEGSGHQHFVDSSPKVYISEDEDRFILVCGERKGGTSYFALDITDRSNPSLLWIIDQSDISELGETWSEPQFGVVDDDGTTKNVFFIGGGYSSDNSLGKAVIAINVLTGAVVKKFTTGMNYSIASSVRLIDGDSNGLVDKVYVGDLGGQMWRFGKFTDGAGDPLDFPDCDENISNWTGQIIFDSTNARKFFYPPSVTLEKEYDLVFMGTGDREDACNETGFNGIYCAKDTHAAATLTEADLVDVTSEAAALPDLDTDQGWYIQLAEGEKVLAEGIVFYKTLYISTFTPNDEPSLPGGAAKFYALNYKTGEAVLDFDGDGNPERSTEIGGGIPSKPVIIITEDSEKLLISTGSTNPEPGSPPGAGIVIIQPLAPPINFFPLWWIEL